ELLPARHADRRCLSEPGSPLRQANTRLPSDGTGVTRPDRGVLPRLIASRSGLPPRVLCTLGENILHERVTKPLGITGNNGPSRQLTTRVGTKLARHAHDRVGALPGYARSPAPDHLLDAAEAISLRPGRSASRRLHVAASRQESSRAGDRRFVDLSLVTTAVAARCQDTVVMP